MLNQPNATTESMSPECALTTSHSTSEIPAAWLPPHPARLEGIAQLETTEPMIKSPSNQPEITFRNPSRKTKIIITLGPTTESSDTLRNLLEAGVSVFQLNLACISRASALKAVFAIRSISTELQRPVSLLLDLHFSPERTPDSPAITESDRADIRFGFECGVDWLAVPAGHGENMVRQVRQFLAEQKRNNIGILARIEDSTGLTALDEIIQDVDGIILGGGNLVSEHRDSETFCIWQRAVQKCVDARKLAVIATGADVISALSARPDALLFTVDTSVGSNLLQSVQTLDSLIRQEESNDPRKVPVAVTLMTEHDRTVAAAVQQANEMKAEGIALFTWTGNSAALYSALRPIHSRVFVFTPDTRLARRLCLGYALETVVLPFAAQPQTTFQAGEKALQKRKLLASGAQIIFVTDILNEGQPDSSVIQVHIMA